MFGLAILLFDFLLEKRDKYLNAVLALIGLGFAAVQLGMFWPLLVGQTALFRALAGLSPWIPSPFSPNSSSCWPRPSSCSFP